MSKGCYHVFLPQCPMVTSSNGNIFRVTGLFVGNSPVTGEFPPQRPVTRSFDVFFICAWRNGWVNNRETGDLRRHRANYDVTIMSLLHYIVLSLIYRVYWNRWVCLLRIFVRVLFRVTPWPVSNSIYICKWKECRFRDFRLMPPFSKLV